MVILGIALAVVGGTIIGAVLAMLIVRFILMPLAELLWP